VGWRLWLNSLVRPWLAIG